MVLNRSSIKWLPKTFFVIGVVVAGSLLVVKGQQVKPEFEMMNTLEKVNVMKVRLVSWLK